MKKLRVGVKYCGNCNPHIDGPALVKKIRARMPEAEMLPAGSPEIDALLIVSGCPVDCATRPSFQGPTVVMGGANIDYVSYDVSQLVEVIIKKLENIKEQII